MKIVFDTSNERIGAQWDRAAVYRLESLMTGQDRTYVEVLAPRVMHAMHLVVSEKKVQVRRVLDVGCGVGYLSNMLAETLPYASVVGIDLSQVSIKLAKEAFRRRNLEFLGVALEEHVSSDYDLVVANMFFSACVNVKYALRRINDLLRDDGLLIATLPHPCFWPRYWGYEREGWFEYTEELQIQTRFRTSSMGTSAYSISHLHRSLGMYLNEIRIAGFDLGVVDEFGATAPVEREGVLLPHFLLISAQKRRTAVAEARPTK